MMWGKNPGDVEISAYDIMTLMKLLETAHMSSTKSEELFYIAVDVVL